ncbi:hypothetical protein FB451DRAFT_1240155 [Mycena latifolia]|nr:hypothetical protein FB451DRAFT_1240155 [Mycena latifolia]
MEITETRMKLLRLEREALYISRHIERCKLPMAPIRRVPPEILSKIFVSYSDLINDSPSFSDVRRGVWLLGHVCGHWRAVGLSTSALWSSFFFSCPAKIRDPKALATEFLRRSGSHPLHRFPLFWRIPGGRGACPLSWFMQRRAGRALISLPPVGSR